MGIALKVKKKIDEGGLEIKQNRQNDGNFWSWVMGISIYLKTFEIKNS